MNSMNQEETPIRPPENKSHQDRMHISCEMLYALVDMFTNLLRYISNLAHFEWELPKYTPINIYILRGSS